MKKTQLVLLGVAAIVAIAVLAIPEAYSLTFWPMDHVFTMAPMDVVAMAVAPMVTSSAIRGFLKKKAQVVGEMTRISETAGDAPFTPEQQSRWAALKAEKDKLERSVEAEVNFVRSEAQLDDPHPAGALAVGYDANGQTTLRPLAASAGGARRAPFNPDSVYANMFPRVSRSDDGFEDAGEFLRALNSGLLDPRMIQAATGGGEAVGADGGFMVPTAFVAQLMDASLEDEIVRSRALIVPMEYNSAFVSGFNTQDHSATIGGFTGVWQSEGVKFTAQKGLVRALTLNAQKLGVLAAATNELLGDSAYYRNDLYSTLAKAIGWYLDLAFLTGTGAGQPKGVLNDPALIVVSKDGGQATSTLSWSNLAGMYERLHPACIKNACWVFNVGTRKALLGLLQPVAITGATGVSPTQPVLQQRADGAFTVLGLPAFFTEKTPAFSSQGDVLLADFTQYAVGLRSEMTISVSQHLYFDSDESAFRALLRADGRGRWSQAMQPKNGATLSWCVTLQAR